MFFLIVTLVGCRAKTRLVVPKNWIFDLDDLNLNNSGLNQNHSYLVYYNSQAMRTPNEFFEPNFRAPRVKNFNGYIEEATFKCKLFKFYRKFTIFFLLIVLAVTY